MAIKQSTDISRSGGALGRTQARSMLTVSHEEPGHCARTLERSGQRNIPLEGTTRKVQHYFQKKKQFGKNKERRGEGEERPSTMEGDKNLVFSPAQSSRSSKRREKDLGERENVILGRWPGIPDPSRKTWLLVPGGIWVPTSRLGAGLPNPLRIH